MASCMGRDLLHEVSGFDWADHFSWVEFRMVPGSQDWEIYEGGGGSGGTAYKFCDSTEWAKGG